jgi:hypothetical protein
VLSKFARVARPGVGLERRQRFGQESLRAHAAPRPKSEHQKGT